MTTFMLVQDAPLHTMHGGASKANRLMLEGLAARGHRCVAVVPSRTMYDTHSRPPLAHELSRRGIATETISPAADRFLIEGVSVYAVTESSVRDWVRYTGLREHIRRLTDALRPDWLLVASEDRGNLLLETAVQTGARVLYIGRSSAMLGLGPMCMFPNPAAASWLRRAAGVVACSEYLAAYVRRWAEVSAIAMDLPVYGAPPFSYYQNFDQGFVTLVNPCAVKGLPILLALALAMPNVPFAVVPTWGTTSEDLERIRKFPNIAVLPPQDDIEKIFIRTKVLLVPSLWDEAFGMIAVEGMLHGLPVLASNVGGLPEAKCGVDYILPVQPIQGYHNRLDGRLVPVPIVPDQDVTPWIETLSKLLTDRNEYERVSIESRQAAEEYVAGLSFGRLETHLAELGNET